MSTTLYPGIAFSPQTVLADNIGAADTIIPVADVSCFPDGPNLATNGRNRFLRRQDGGRPLRLPARRGGGGQDLDGGRARRQKLYGKGPQRSD